MTWPTPQLRVAVRWLSRDRQTLTPLGAPTTEYTPTRRGAHSHAKTVRLLSMSVIRLEGALHLFLPVPHTQRELLIIPTAFRPCQRLVVPPVGWPIYRFP